MTFYQSVKTIDTSAERIWEVLINVETWPTVTPSITSVTPLDTPPVAIGNRYRVVQPKLRPATYKVTQLDFCRNFTWEAHSFECTIKAEHLIRAFSTSCELAIRLSFHGFFGHIIGLIAGSTTRDYIELEAQGFKKECEQESP